MAKDIFKDIILLTQFILKLQVLPDTPAVIQFVAAEEDYLQLCSRIANAANDHCRDFKLLNYICRKQGFDFHLLKEKLVPVARAFGMVEDESNYYELLGVSRQATTADIRKTFRKRVIEVHPDTCDQVIDSGREFIHLKTAYEILCDPFLRRKYDETLKDVHLWKENAEKAHRQSEFLRLKPFISQNENQKQAARTKIYYQLGGLFLLLIIVVFILDFIYRQNAIIDDDYNVKQKQVLEQKLTKEAVQEASDSKTDQNRSEVKSSPDTKAIY